MKEPNSNSVIGEPSGFTKASSYILANRNDSANPCDDFYEFVCGNYANNKPLSGTYVWQNIEKSRHLQLLELLQRPVPPRSKSLSKVKMFLDACVRDLHDTNKTSLAILETIKSVGQWPILMGDSDMEIDLQQMFEKMRHVQAQLPWTIEEIWDDENKSLSLKLRFDVLPTLPERWTSEKLELMLKQGVAPFDDEFIQERFSIRMMDVLERILQFAKDTGYPENIYLENDVEEMFKFGSDFYALGLDLKEIYLAGIPENAQGLINSQILIELQPSFVEKILDFIKNTEARILTNYLIYFFLSKYDVPKAFPYFTEKIPSIHQSCHFFAVTRMPIATEALFASLHLDFETHYVITEMNKDFKAAYLEIINEWLNEEGKKESRMLFAKYRWYREMLLNDDKLDDYYEEFDAYNENDFYSMIKSVETVKLKNQYKKLKHKLEPLEEFSDAMFIDYDPLKNSLISSIALLQFPIFLKDQPQALNYGALGPLITRDLSNLLVREKYIYECLFEQHTSDKVFCGVQTSIQIDENVGVKKAFKAFQKYLDRSEVEPHLSFTLGLTNEQLFFVGYANAHCTSLKKEHQTSSDDFTSFPPNRINIVMKNMPEFSKAFNCPVGSPMNPIKQCPMKPW